MKNPVTRQKNTSVRTGTEKTENIKKQNDYEKKSDDNIKQQKKLFQDSEIQHIDTDEKKQHTHKKGGAGKKASKHQPGAVKFLGERVWKNKWKVPTRETIESIKAATDQILGAKTKGLIEGKLYIILYDGEEKVYRLDKVIVAEKTVHYVFICQKGNFKITFSNHHFLSGDVTFKEK